MPDPLLDATRRVQRAWSADGLAELAAGTLFLLLALLELGKWHSAPGDTAWRVWNLLQILVMMPGLWFVIWGLPRVRNRLFGDRAGIMIPRMAPGGVPKAAGAVIVAVMTGVVLVAMRSKEHWVTLTILGMGLGAAGILLRLGYESGIRRYWVLGGVVGLASIGVAAAAVDFQTSFVAVAGLIGLLLVATGAVTVARYLQAGR